MYSAKQMFDIVADIESYPKFLQWCSGARVLQQDVNQVTASVDIKYKGIQQSFCTQNSNVDAVSIHMILAEDESSFDSLEGCWTFSQIDADQGEACKVEFNLDFSMKNKIAATVFKTVFSQILNSQVDGFIQRAQDLYG